MASVCRLPFWQSPKGTPCLSCLFSLHSTSHFVTKWPGWTLGKLQRSRGVFLPFKEAKGNICYMEGNTVRLCHARPERAEVWWMDETSMMEKKRALIETNNNLTLSFGSERTEMCLYKQAYRLIICHSSAVVKFAQWIICSWVQLTGTEHFFPFLHSESTHRLMNVHSSSEHCVSDPHFFRISSFFVWQVLMRS